MRFSVVQKDTQHAQIAVNIEKKRRQKLDCDFYFLGEKAHEQHIGHGKHDAHTYQSEKQIFEGEKRKHKQNAKHSQNHKIQHGRENMLELNKTGYGKYAR